MRIRKRLEPANIVFRHLYDDMNILTLDRLFHHFAVRMQPREPFSVFKRQRVFRSGKKAPVHVVFNRCKQVVYAFAGDGGDANISFPSGREN